jgi:glutathione synthase/RimK-type ligase-like ATP-grasp enzyme
VAELWIADHEGSRSADPETQLLIEALDRLGLTAVRRDWHQPGAWDTTNLTLIRSTWDYTTCLDDFLAWTRAVPGLENPAEVIAWNCDKSYLLELAASSVPTVESLVLAAGERAALPSGPLVVKPAIGAGSRLAASFASAGSDLDAHLQQIWASGSRALIQPEITSVAAVGELNLVFFGGEYSHAARKGPMLGREDDLDPSGLSVRENLSLEIAPAQAIAVAKSAMDAVEAIGLTRQALLYGRVDLFEDDGNWLVSELELIEPALFLDLAEGSADNLASQLLARLDER